MIKRMHRRAAISAAALAALSLSGCVASAWVYDSPPAAGTQTDAQGLKLRNFMIVADEKGDAILLGAITARDSADSVIGFAYAPETEQGGTYEQPKVLEFSQDIRKGQTIYLDGKVTQFNNPQLRVGRLASLQAQFSSGQIIQLTVPVMSSQHKDVQDAWAKAHA